MSPAATPDTSASPAQHFQPQNHASITQGDGAGPGSGMDETQIRAELERTLLKLSQDLYEMEICAGDVIPGQEDRVPQYLYVPLLSLVKRCREELMGRRAIDRGLIQLSELAGMMGDTVPRQIVE